MTSRSNVLPLRPYQQAPRWQARLLVVATYWLAAFALPNLNHPWEAIDIVMLLAIAYWALVHHRKHWVSYYVRYHWLQLLLLTLVLGVGLAVIMAFLDLILSILPIVGLQVIAAKTLFMVEGATFVGTRLIMFLVPFFLGLASLLGKSPSLPALSDQARHWA